MKRLILIFVLSFFGGYVTSQENNNSVDTSEFCLPLNVMTQIMIDLNDLDRLKKITELQEKEIEELNNKVEVYEKIVETYELKDSLNNVIIDQVEQKVDIYKDENERLYKENKRLKRRNNILSIISTSVILPLTYIILFK
jgi:vacuolar-type H+-ATPase subunit I/STV1